MTRVIFLLLMLLGFNAAYALAEDLLTDWRRNAPLWVSAAVLVGSMMALVIRQPIGGFQDFRYVPMLLVPAAFYALLGIKTLPARLRPGARQFAYLLLLAFGAFYLLLLQS